MNFKNVMKRAAAFILALGVLLIMAASIPGETVSAATFTYTKNFNRFASSYTGTISMPTQSFSINENASWITVTKSSYNTFKISITENKGLDRDAVVKIYNGGSTYIYNIYQSAGDYLLYLIDSRYGSADIVRIISYDSYFLLPEPYYADTKFGSSYDYYIFWGWSATPNALTPTYVSGRTYKNLPSQLYAIWYHVVVPTGF